MSGIFNVPGTGLFFKIFLAEQSHNCYYPHEQKIGRKTL